MNIFVYAKQMEKDGENFYRELAEESRLEGMKSIFNMLAGEEVKHFQVIEALERREDKPLLAETAVLENVKNIFVWMQAEKKPISFAASELALYRKAMDIEDLSRKFYLEKGGEDQNEKVKRVFLQLAGEEEKHYRIMRTIVDFVSRPEPGYWLENAEWHHLEEY